jgi:hypothetical protein
LRALGARWRFGAADVEGEVAGEVPTDAAKVAAGDGAAVAVDPTGDEARPGPDSKAS